MNQDIWAEMKATSSLHHSLCEILRVPQMAPIRRDHFANDLHRGRGHRYFPRNTLPHGRVYGRQRYAQRGHPDFRQVSLNRAPGRPLLFAQQSRPHNRRGSPTQRGHGSNLKTLLEIIIKDLLPLNTVKGSHLTQSLQLSSYTPSRIRNELQNLYRDKRLEVQNVVNNARNLALSAELWNSSEKAFYLTVSCHLISKNWELKSYMLDTAHLLTEHTAEKANEQLLRISNEWNVTEKTQFVVTNVDGIKKAHNNGCSWTYIPCFAYTLDKVFRETIMGTESEFLLRKCQQIVAFFHQNEKASQKLQEYRKSLNLERKELTQSSSIKKWFPTLHMLKNILVLWPAIFKVFVDKRVDSLDLNENERKRVEHIVAVLDILKDVTQEVGKEGFSPISNIIPLVQTLQERLRDLMMMENRIAEKLAEMCEHHIGSIKKILWFRVSTALDPRYKTRLLRDSGIEDVAAEIRRRVRGETHSYDTESEESVWQKYWKLTGSPVNTFEFWKTKEEFEKLAKVARSYLTVVSTAIPMERVHQLHNSHTVNRRNCLEPENLNMILFLNSNQ